MSLPSHTDVILETIDQLRKRKARPDLERICHMVERRHGLSFSETEASLLKLVEDQIVIKVDYKGNTSYRNAAKWRKGPVSGQVLVSTSATKPFGSKNDASRKIAYAIRAMLKQKTECANGDVKKDEAVNSAAVDSSKFIQFNEQNHEQTQAPVAQALAVEVPETCRPTTGNNDNGSKSAGNSGNISTASLVQGVSLDEIEKIITEEYPHSVLVKNELIEAMEKEIALSHVMRLDDGTYMVTASAPQIVASKDKKKTTKAPKTKRKPKESKPKVDKKAGKELPSPDNGTIELINVEKNLANMTAASGQLPITIESIATTPAIINSTSPLAALKRKEPVGLKETGIFSPQKKNTRPPAKRKRFKKTHGPDFESYGIASKVQEDRCDFCTLTASSNRFGNPEDLLICKDCNAKAHPSCMTYSAQLAERASRSPWQCIDCKTCCVCQLDAGDPDSMLFCDACDKGYHMNCHLPPLTEKPTGKWMCQACLVEDIEIQRNLAKLDGEMAETSHLPITPSVSPLPSTECLKTGMSVIRADPEQTQMPDASVWSINDVVGYLSSVGFSEQAVNFREEEIDGQSLLLMKRNDILTGLGLKLGPALKIHNIIKKLQFKTF